MVWLQLSTLLHVLQIILVFSFLLWAITLVVIYPPVVGAPTHFSPLKKNKKDTRVIQKSL